MARTKKDILLKDWLKTDNPILNLYQLKVFNNGNKWVITKHPMNRWKKGAWEYPAGEVNIDTTQNKELKNREDQINKLIAELNKRPLTFWDLISQMFSSNKGK